MIVKAYVLMVILGELNGMPTMQIAGKFTSVAKCEHVMAEVAKEEGHDKQKLQSTICLPILDPGAPTEQVDRIIKMLNTDKEV